MLLNIHDILTTFIAFMTAARKIIVLDLEYTNAQDIAAIGLVVLCLGVTYWFLGKKEENKKEHLLKKFSLPYLRRDSSAENR